MIHIDNTIQLIGLTQYSDVISLDHTLIDDTRIDCWITLKKASCSCPHCGHGSNSPKIKEYKEKNVSHSYTYPRKTSLHVRFARFICKNCNKTFSQPVPFVFNDFPHLSSYTVVNCLEELKRENHSFAEIAEHNFISKQTVIDIFNSRVSFPHGKPTSYICIDEKCYVHGNTKFSLVILDFQTKTVLDLCKDRKKNTLLEWLRFVRDNYVKPPEDEFMDTSSGLSIGKNRDIELKAFCIDMSGNYYDAIKQVFPYVTVAVDSFHVMQLILNAFNKVRITIMNSYKKEKKVVDPVTGEVTSEEESEDKQPLEYRVLKKYIRLMNLTEFIERKNPEEKRFNRMLNRYCDAADVLDYCLNINPRLKEAWVLKQLYAYFNATASYEDAGPWLDKLIQEYANSDLQSFRAVAKTLLFWKEEIINSFILVDGRRLSNGAMEGMNSRIEKLIITSNGLPHFDMLRKRVIYCFGSKGFMISDNINIKQSR